jgi:hypothetical protein
VLLSGSVHDFTALRQALLGVSLPPGALGWAALGEMPASSARHCCTVGVGAVPLTAAQYVERIQSTFRPGRPGRLSALSVFHSKSVLYGAFVWARRALNNPKRRFPARAVTPIGVAPGSSFGFDAVRVAGCAALPLLDKISAPSMSANMV